MGGGWTINSIFKINLDETQTFAKTSGSDITAVIFSPDRTFDRRSGKVSQNGEVFRKSINFYIFINTNLY